MGKIWTKIQDGFGTTITQQMLSNVRIGFYNHLQTLFDMGWGGGGGRLFNRIFNVI